MRVGQPAARLLIQRLVVPQAEFLDAEQSCGRLADNWMESERADGGRVLPQIDALNERLLVGRLVAELAIVETFAARDRFIDGGAVAIEFVGRRANRAP